MSNTELAVFIAGAIVGLGVGAGVDVSAASGDLIFQKSEITEITGAQAANIADAYIAQGYWTGDRADMLSCKTERTSLSTTGFRTVCFGTDTSPPGSLPINGGVVVVGVEP